MKTNKSNTKFHVIWQYLNWYLTKFPKFTHRKKTVQKRNSLKKNKFFQFFDGFELKLR